MAVSPRLARKLHETLGVEATEDLMNWMDQTDSIRGDIAEVRHELQVLSGRMDTRFANLETLIEKRSYDLIKWSFVFWVSAIGAIAALARVLR